MRISAVVIENYRQYRKLKLEFPAPARGGYDLNVLVGKNGFGKTNLANALCWCLWLREPDLALHERNSGKPIYNTVAMDDVRKDRGRGLVVSVAVQIELDDRTRSRLLVNRKVFCNSRGLVEEPQLTVVRTSKVGSAFSGSGDEAQDEINRWYPSDLSDYLIFDGERLTTYFQSGQASKIRQSVINLSGIQKLNEAIRHHEEILRELTGRMTDLGEGLSEAGARRDAAIAAWKRNEEDLGRYEEEIARSNVRISELKELISGHENVPELLHQRDVTANLVGNVERELAAVRDRKCELIRKYYPILAVMEHVPSVRAYVSRKREKNQFPPPIKREVFEEILKVGTCSVCGTALSEEARTYILGEIDKYNQTVVSTETYEALTNLIEPKAIAFGERLRQYQESRNAILDKEAGLLESLEALQRSLQDINDRLSLVDDAESFQQKVEELNRRETALSRTRDMLGACRANRDRLAGEKDDACTEFNRLSLKNARDDGLRERISILQKSSIAIDYVRQRMLDEVRHGIEEKANKYWKELMWKPADEIGTIRFDMNFQLSLMNGEQPLIGTLSAAERVMLALSITWAIHSQAGMNFPFFIDTPVSNMSSDSRRDFAMTLKEIASDKQVVLLFTDTEYVAEVPEAFGDGVNMQRTLSYSQGVTTIG